MEIVEFSMVGRFLTKKFWNNRLLITVLGWVWGVDGGWSLKILAQNDNMCFYGDHTLYNRIIPGN